jgi:hypothetical protein
MPDSGCVIPSSHAGGKTGGACCLRRKTSLHRLLLHHPIRTDFGGIRGCRCTDQPRCRVAGVDWKPLPPDALPPAYQSIAPEYFLLLLVVETRDKQPVALFCINFVIKYAFTDGMEFQRLLRFFSTILD